MLYTLIPELKKRAERFIGTLRAAIQGATAIIATSEYLWMTQLYAEVADPESATSLLGDQLQSINRC